VLDGTMRIVHPHRVFSCGSVGHGSRDLAGELSPRWEARVRAAPSARFLAAFGELMFSDGLGALFTVTPQVPERTALGRWRRDSIPGGRFDPTFAGDPVFVGDGAVSRLDRDRRLNSVVETRRPAIDISAYGLPADRVWLTGYRICNARVHDGTGARLWRRRTRLYVQMAVDDLVLGSCDTRVVAAGRDGGSDLWSRELGTMPIFVGVRDDLVWLYDDRTLVGLSLERGEVRHRLPTDFVPLGGLFDEQGMLHLAGSFRYARFDVSGTPRLVLWRDLRVADRMARLILHAVARDGRVVLTDARVDGTGLLVFDPTVPDGETTRSLDPIVRWNDRARWSVEALVRTPLHLRSVAVHAGCLFTLETSLEPSDEVTLRCLGPRAASFRTPG
jgi:hypothetical protein